MQIHRRTIFHSCGNILSLHGAGDGEQKAAGKIWERDAAASSTVEERAAATRSAKRLSLLAYHYSEEWVAVAKVPVREKV